MITVAAGVVVLLAAGLVVVQVRAGQAQQLREEAADLAAQDEAARRAAAEQAERQAAAEQAAEQWAVAATDAGVRLAAADAVLADSNGRVAEDAVRLALADAIDAVRTLVAADAPAVPRLARAVEMMSAAEGQVTVAQTAWQAEQDAAAAQAAAEAQAARAAEAARQAQAAPGASGRESGAGADCGGPGSYEPPKGSGPTFYTSTPTASGDGSNGNIPAERMSPLGWCVDAQGNSQWLQSAAAAALAKMNEAFRAEFGENLAVDMSYRSYQTQVEMRRALGSVAAEPGTSNHGTGLAFDTWEWQAYAFGSARYDWLVAHGPEHGWVAPGWARQNGANPEYWHFEYAG